MSWVQSIVLFFSYLGWTLFAVGLVVSAFECGIDYQNGRGSVKDSLLSALKGFLAVGLFTTVPVKLFELSVNLQASLTSGITGYGSGIDTLATGIIDSLNTAGSLDAASNAGIFGGLGAITSPIMHGVEWGKIRRLHQRITYHYSPEPSPRQTARTSGRSSKKPSELRTTDFQFLDLRPGGGNLLGPCWETNAPLLGEYWTLNTGASPKDAVESSLSRILQATVPRQYYLSRTACLGILRRAEERGKDLPAQLEAALELQAGITELPIVPAPSQNGSRNVAGFCAGAGPSAGTIGYQEERAPTLKASASGNMNSTTLPWAFLTGTFANSTWK